METIPAEAGRQEIVIDFSRMGEGEFDVDNLGQLIQRDALKEIETCLSKAFTAAVNYRVTLETTDNIDDLSRRCAAITIHGGRGSGKTTFTNYLLREIHGIIARDENICQNDIKRSIATRLWTAQSQHITSPKLLRMDNLVIHKLRVLDPTLIETNHNIMVVVISLINDAVRTHARRCGQQDDNDNSCSSTLDQWSKSLQRLTEGLALIDGIFDESAARSDLMDSYSIMTRGLHKAESGVNFEVNFHRFVNDSLKILEADCFLLAFDDVDTSFDRGWPVLETLRKYLTTPQLIVIVSGDMDAYSLLVRSHVWKNFGQELLLNEQWNAHPDSVSLATSSRIKQINTQVDRLESQYLLKVLKSENRIDLAPLVRYAAHRSDLSLVAKFPGNDQPFNIFRCLNELFRQALAIRSEADLQLYRDLILRLPVRTFINLLLGSREFWVKTDYNDKSHHICDFKLSLNLQEAFRNSFSSSLLSSGIVPDDVRGGFVARLIALVANYLIHNDGWRSRYRLRSDDIDDEVNITLIALSSALVRSFDLQPGTVITYLLRICLVRSSIYQRRYKELDMSAYMDFLSLSRQESMGQTLGRVLAWKMANSSEESAFTAGRGCLVLTAPKEDLVGQLQQIMKQDPRAAIAGRLALMKIIGHGGRVYQLISPMVLLSFVGDLLSTTFSDAQADEMRETATSVVKELLIRYTANSGMFMPAVASQSNTAPAEFGAVLTSELPTLRQEEIEGETFQEFLEILVTWRLAWGAKWQDGVIIRTEAPATFATIWERFMTVVDERETQWRSRQHEQNIGQILSDYIFDLLDSFRIVLSETNPTTPAHKIYDNEPRPIVDFFNALISCPVWWMFMDPSRADTTEWKTALDFMFENTGMKTITNDNYPLFVPKDGHKFHSLFDALKTLRLNN